MEHPCSKCGKLVEDGTPFCSECGEPQIRVTLASPYEPPPGTAVPPPSIPEQPPQVSLQDFHRPVTGPVDWRRAWPGALVAGMLTILLSVVLQRPQLMFVCILAGGAFSVSAYRRRTRVDALRPGQGFRIGALAGIFSFGFVLIMFIGFAALFSEASRAGMSPEMRQVMDQALQQAASFDPQSQQQLQNTIAMLSTPEGLANVLLGLLFLLVFFVLLAGGGGALSAKIFGPRDSHS